MKNAAQIFKKSLIITIAILIMIVRSPVLNAFEARTVSVTAKIERSDIKTCDDEDGHSEDGHKDDDEDDDEEYRGDKEDKDDENQEEIAEGSGDEVIIDEKLENETAIVEEVVIEIIVEEAMVEIEEDNFLPEYLPYQEEDKENQEDSAPDTI